MEINNQALRDQLENDKTECRSINQALQEQVQELSKATEFDKVEYIPTTAQSLSECLDFLQKPSERSDVDQNNQALREQVTQLENEKAEFRLQMDESAAMVTALQTRVKDQNEKEI